MHVIRLKRPWEKLTNCDEASTRVEVPEPEADERSTANAIRRATYTRFFNRPSGLDATTKVLLRITQWQGRLESISLNGQQLDHDGQALQIDVANRLVDRNELVIVLATENNVVCRLSGEVDLAIQD